jgi:hypothetical protein
MSVWVYTSLYVYESVYVYMFIADPVNHRTWLGGTSYRELKSNI